jgi:hypothetical protein
MTDSDSRRKRARSRAAVPCSQSLPIQAIRVPILAIVVADDPLKFGVDSLKRLLPKAKVVVIDYAHNLDVYTRLEFVSALTVSRHQSATEQRVSGDARLAVAPGGRGTRACRSGPGSGKPSPGGTSLAQSASPERRTAYLRAIGIGGRRAARPRGALTLLSRLSREAESPEVVLGSKAIASALAYSLWSRGHIRLTL